MKYDRRTISFALFLAIACLAVPAVADTIRVPADQPTIQAGIDAAGSGDTVLVAPGTYSENIDFIGKAITVVSDAGPDQTTIFAGQPGSVVTFVSGEGPDSVLEGFTIRGGTGTGSAYANGGGVYCIDSSPSIIGNTVTANDVDDGSGGGIYCRGGAPEIRNNLIRLNRARAGGGISCYETLSRIEGNMIRRNTADGRLDHQGWGGGICISRSGTAENPLQLVNNLIVDNLAFAWFTYPDEFSAYGGGMAIINSTVVVDHCTVGDNWADTMYHGLTYGGALCVAGGAVVQVSSSILYRDHAVDDGHEVAMVGWEEAYPYLRLDYSCVQYGPENFYINDPLNVYVWGDGMMTDLPRFVYDQPYYLCHVVSGQPWNSPCVDAGDPAGPLVSGTTRTDGYHDVGVTDMGFHYPSATAAFVIAGPGPAQDNPPLVRVFPAEQDALHLYEFEAYGTPRYGVNVAAAKLDGSEGVSLLTGAGPGDVFGPHLRGFELDGTPLPGLNYFAYGTLKYGVNVAAGDFHNDGADEIVTGAGPGAVFGPHVRAFRYEGEMVTPIPGVSFFAYGTLKYGVNVACGDLDGDLRDEIVTGAGPGAVFGPHVRGWDVDGDVAAAMPGVNYFAYGTPRYGVRVACGDVDGDGLAEIVTAPGPSALFGAHVRGWDVDGTEVTAIPGISFFAWPPEEARYGARVSSGADLDGDDCDDILVAPGPDPAIGSPVHVYGYSNGQTTELFSLTAFDGLTHGASIASGRI